MKDISVFLFMFLFLFRCGSQAINLHPTFNDGLYEFIELKNEELLNQDSIVVFGKILDLNNDNMNIDALLQLGCNKVNSNNSFYRFKTKPFGVNSQMKAISIGYLTIETKPFKTVAGDSIMINFYMAEDMRPLINCEGQ